MSVSIQEIRAVLKKNRAALLNRPNVVATGIGYKITNNQKTDQLALICSVDSKKAKKNLSEKDQIPSQIEGIPCDVQVSGVIRAFSDPRRKHRPAPGGVSVGHERVTAGTLGCLVSRGGKRYILSNNHVLANSNEGSKGDAILQPGRYDGGEWPLDRIAELSDYVPIQFDGGDSICSTAGAAAGILNILAAALGRTTRLRPVHQAESENLVDCAIAKPLDSDDVINEILNIGTIRGIAEGVLDMAVQKSGRTTGYTKSTIQQVDVTVKVNYSSSQVATFVDQLVAGPMSQGGDSGSAVLDMDNNITGLLFAGSDTITVINRIEHVFEALQVELP